MTEDYTKWKAIVKELLADERVKHDVDTLLTNLFGFNSGTDRGGKIIVRLEKGNEAAVLKSIGQILGTAVADKVKKEREGRKDENRGLLPDHGQELGGEIKIWFFADDLEGGYANGFSTFDVLHVMLDLVALATEIFNRRTGKGVPAPFPYHSDLELAANIRLMGFHLADLVIRYLGEHSGVSDEDFKKFIEGLFGDIPKWTGVGGDQIRQVLVTAKGELDRLARGERDPRVRQLLEQVVALIKKILDRVKKP